MIEGTEVLIVDDSPDILDVLGEFLRLHGCLVHEARTGKEALKILSEEKVEAVIADVKLPDTNGISLLEGIKSLDPTIPVIMITGYFEPNLIVDSMRKGASDFILKPIEFERLILALFRAKRERELLLEKMRIQDFLDDKKKILFLNRELQEKIKEISLMYQISEKFNTIKLEEDIFEKVLEVVGEIFEGRSCAYYVVDSKEKKIVPFKTRGTREIWRSITVPEATLDDLLSKKRHMEMENLFFVPVVIKGECVGFIGMEGKRKNGKLEEGELLLLKTIAEKSSVHIENRMLYESLFQNIIQTLKSLVISINRRDAYTSGHCERVTKNSVRVGEILGVSDYEKNILKVTGSVHDVGKIGIPDAILLKPGRLTEEEYRIMKNHSVYGEEIISRFEILANEAKIVKHHHERFDGRGYPDGLLSDEIPLCSRIIAVCDAYDAMVTERPYRRALSREEALSEIKRCRGTQFDPQVVDAFMEMMDEC